MDCSIGPSIMIPTLSHSPFSSIINLYFTPSIEHRRRRQIHQRHSLSACTSVVSPRQIPIHNLRQLIPCIPMRPLNLVISRLPIRHIIDLDLGLYQLIHFSQPPFQWFFNPSLYDSELEAHISRRSAIVKQIDAGKNDTIRE